MTIEYVTIDGITGAVADTVTCLCGNEPHIDGFYPCLSTGEVIEPEGYWDEALYYCESCHRIINMITGAVTGQADHNTVITNERRFDQ